MALDLRGLCPLLHVFDMPTSLRFYRDVLGFQIVGSSPDGQQGQADNYGWTWLRHGATELMLNTAFDPDAERPPLPETARVAAHEDTALYMGCPDIDAAYRHLRVHGLDVAPPTVAWYGMKQLYLKDPDGFVLCFQWRADGAASAAEG